jgi:MFS family permease
MVPVARLILVRSVQKSELVRALAVMSMPALVGPIIGPLIGGFLTSYASWRWIFWINLPVGILGVLLVTAFIAEAREAPRRFDAFGALLSSVGLCAALFGIDSASTEDRLSLLSAVCLAVGLVALLGYVLHARRTTEPILDTRIFRIASFRASVVGGSVFRIGVGAMPFLLPLLFQQAFGYTPFESGLTTFVSAVGSFGMRTISSRVLTRFGFRTVLVWDGLISALSVAACIFFRADTPYLVIALVLFLGGVFRSLHLMTLNALAFADLTHAQMSHATSFSTMAQRLSQSVSVAFTAFILHSATTGAAPTHATFVIALLVMAAMAALSSLLMTRLHPDAGAELAGRKPQSAPPPGPPA